MIQNMHATTSSKSSVAEWWWSLKRLLRLRSTRNALILTASCAAAGITVAILCVAIGAEKSLETTIPKDSPTLVGWEGEVTRLAGTHNIPGLPSDAWLEYLSWEPPIAVFHNFLTMEEADALVAKARPTMKRARVVDHKTGGSTVSDARTSTGTHFKRGETATIRAIEERLAAWTLLPVENGEAIQVLQYQEDQQYRPHFDYFLHSQGLENGANRVKTVVMYLSTPEEGGETVFPDAVAIHPERTEDPSLSPCAQGKVALKARKRDAVMFVDMKPNGNLHRGSRHGGCPVIKGEKWVATKWIHAARYAHEKEEHVAYTRVFRHGLYPDCQDLDDQCQNWMAWGQCEKNAPFMVGEVGKPGKCAMSCERCEVWANAEAERDHSDQSAAVAPELTGKAAV